MRIRYLVVYDIRDPRRLQRVAKVLADYGHRVQRSKFEIEVGPAALRELYRRLAAEIEPAEDGVKYIPLCRSCQARIEVIGQGSYIEPDAEYVVT